MSENACIGDYYQCAKFHVCIKKCTIQLKFQAMPPDYAAEKGPLHRNLVPRVFRGSEVQVHFALFKLIQYKMAYRISRLTNNEK